MGRQSGPEQGQVGERERGRDRDTVRESERDKERQRPRAGAQTGGEGKRETEIPRDRKRWVGSLGEGERLREKDREKGRD